MTREELEALVLFVRQHRSKGHPPYEAIIHLADGRDAAIKQRDRALALLREWCDDIEQRIEDGDCLDDSGSGRERIATGRALLAEVDG